MNHGSSRNGRRAAGKVNWLSRSDESGQMRVPSRSLWTLVIRSRRPVWTNVITGHPSALAYADEGSPELPPLVKSALTHATVNAKHCEDRDGLHWHHRPQAPLRLQAQVEHRFAKASPASPYELIVSKEDAHVGNRDKVFTHHQI